MVERKSVRKLCTFPDSVFSMVLNLSFSYRVLSFTFGKCPVLYQLTVWILNRDQFRPAVSDK